MLRGFFLLLKFQFIKKGERIPGFQVGRQFYAFLDQSFPFPSSCVASRN